MNVQIYLLIVVDSKDLYNTLSTCRNATDKSIRPDVSLIRYEFETRKVNRMIWVPGKANLADPFTKPGSPLCQPLQFMMFSGELPMDFDDAKFRSSDQYLGSFTNQWGEYEVLQVAI